MSSSDRSVRVALLCHYPDDDRAPAGGVWAVGRNLAAGMAHAGAEVHVVRYLAAGSGQPRVCVNGTPPLVVHTVELPRRRSQPLRRVAAVPALAAALQDIGPDAITAHESEYGLAALRSGFPTAVTIHGIPRQELRAFHQWRSQVDLAITVWQDWLMVRRVQDVVAINQYALEQYRRRAAGRVRFHRIDVPIGDVFFDAPSREPDANTLLMVGANERKDPLTMLQAVALVRANVPDVRLRIAGRVPAGAFGAAVERTIDELGLRNCVEFLGPLNQPALAEAYTAAAVTVLSSRQETSPAVLMEAMAARRPVVAIAVGGVAEIVAHGESGWVAPAGNPAEFALRIGDLLQNPARARAMGAYGRDLAEQRYRRNLVGRQYVALLSGLAGRLE